MPPGSAQSPENRTEGEERPWQVACSIAGHEWAMGLKDRRENEDCLPASRRFPRECLCNQQLRQRDAGGVRKAVGEALCDLIEMGAEKKGNSYQMVCHRGGDEAWD